MELNQEAKHQLKKGDTYFKAIFIDGEANFKYVVGYYTSRIEANKALDRWVEDNIDGGFAGLTSGDDMYVVEYAVVSVGEQWRAKAVCSFSEENA
jgi:hypothetical protein